MTSFDTIIDLALITVQDYKLDKLYNQSEQAFKTQCDAYLISAIPNFTECRQSLDYNTVTREFASDLTDMEISILADLWCIEWFKKQTQDVTQIQAKLQISSGFTSHSAAQNLKEKSTYLDKLREKVSQKIVDYQLQDILKLESFQGWYQ